MKFLVIEQDLRVAGTSQGIISRSFLAKLRKSYPQSVIDVVYLKSTISEDDLHLLPVDSIQYHVLDLKIPFFTKWINKIYWRLFHVSLKDEYIYGVYASYIAKIDFKSYDHIFIRSAGLDHEIILATYNLPILKKAIVNFHDPYPLPWYVGTQKIMTNLDLFRLKKMAAVVSQAKTCSSSAQYMSHDLQYLYASKKKFYTLPHQFDASVFDLSDTKQMLLKTKKVTISHHGAIMFGRNVDILLDAYQELVENNILYQENTEFILRLKGHENNRLRNKYASIKNIQIFDTLNFSNSSNEQIYETDIAIILENGPIYCNILVGKAPFLATYNKPVLSVSPPKSELRNILLEQKYIAAMDNKEEIKFKLEQLILDRLESDSLTNPFGEYFSDINFKKSLDEILYAK
ncbi:MAG: hypothetical protein A3F91_02075 [Flavobacteria bacterium RIFCSPLOWO2_12_FULL_35_11]|nr:MAG: hypothetical protein A3F91_02075 [Flavobacteria bacterium RIFCSPLOWO2_12_FULL_35_11]